MSNYLVHFGIKGQKWGDRRYQNEDGTLTAEGKIRYTKEGYKELKIKYKKDVKEATSQVRKYKKEMGLLKPIQRKERVIRAVHNVDNFAYKKADELYNKYKNLKMYKAKLKGKDFDVSKTGMKTYFSGAGMARDVFGFSMAHVSYTVMPNGDKNFIEKNATRVYVY